MILSTGHVKECFIAVKWIQLARIDTHDCMVSVAELSF